MYRESVYKAEDSFSSKVKHNFKTQLLLCLKGKNWTREDILSTIYGLPGYKCHKVARYGYKWSHIHIKFEEEYQAQSAIIELGNVNSDLAAVLVDDMLREWYKFEMKFGYGPSWTMTVVDTVGFIPHSLNFLTENILNYLFQDFGKPYLLPYTAALNELHVQMAFYSMTEALAACMAFGQWYRMNAKLDQFCYRVRINPAHRETFLIRNCGGNPEEAFMLDYFVKVRNDVIQSQETNGWDNSRNENGYGFGDLPHSSECNKETFQNPNIQESRTDRSSRKLKNYQNESRNGLVPQKTRRHKQHQTSTTHLSNANFQQKQCSPLVCLPIITPLNSSCTQAFVSSGQISVDFTKAFMNLPKSYAEALESDSNAATKRKMLTYDSTSGKESVEMAARSNEELDKSVITCEKDASDDLNPTPVFNPTVPDSNYPQKAKSKKHTGKRSARVFERREVPQPKNPL